MVLYWCHTMDDYVQKTRSYFFCFLSERFPFAIAYEIIHQYASERASKQAVSNTHPPTHPPKITTCCEKRTFSCHKHWPPPLNTHIIDLVDI